MKVGSSHTIIFYCLLGFVAFTILTRVPTSCPQSLDNDLYSISDIYSASYSNSIQYCVSVASLRAMFILLEKSGRLCAFFPSWTLAPILVPERKICFDNTYSFLSLRNLYRFIILKEKRLDKAYISLTPFIIVVISLKFQPSTFNLQPSTFNLQLSTFNLQLSTFNLQLKSCVKNTSLKSISTEEHTTASVEATPTSTDPPLTL